MSQGRLIFDWPARHRIHLLLPFMIFVAALAHASIFFLFTIVYPQAGKDGLKPAQVFFLPSESPQIAEIEEALYSQDPALFAPGGGLSDPVDGFHASYSPQYSESDPALTPLALKFPVRNFFDTPKASLEISRQPTRRRPREAISTEPRLIAQAPLAHRLPNISEKTGFPTSAETPASAFFLVGVSRDGRLDYVILQQSSGNEELDRAAMNYLRKSLFKPSAESGIQWGFVEIQWGAPNQPPASP